MSERRGLLVRVGIDASFGGWNAPVYGSSGEFVYVPIPEPLRARKGMARKYAELKTCLKSFGAPLPAHLNRSRMHLDPDFEHLSYGDLGRKGQRISRLKRDDLIVFYAGLRNLEADNQLVYAIIGFYVVDRIQSIHELDASQYHQNAHSRCQFQAHADDIIVFAKPKLSGRLTTCLSIGSRRAARNRPEGAPVYRVLPELLEEWGGLSNNDGYLQRSAVPPALNDVDAFERWFHAQQPELQASNW